MMFFMVDEKYPDRAITDQKDWYKTRYWTMEQEEKFRSWMTAHLRVKGKYSKKMAEIQTAYFMLMYGWTNKVPFCMMALNGNKERS